MKKSILAALLPLLTVLSLLLTLAACSVDGLEGEYAKKVTLDLENYEEYLKVETRIDSNIRHIYPYSDLRWVDSYYVRPFLKVRVTPIDDTVDFGNVTVTVSVGYVFKRLTSSNIRTDRVGIDDIVEETVSITLDPDGTGTAILASSKSTESIYACGITGATVLSVKGTAGISCLHEWGESELEVPPGCESKGRAVIPCKLCDAKKTEELEPIGHDGAEHAEILREPTCTEAGEQAHYCERCGNEVKEIIEALGHDYNEAEAVTVPATCTEEGSVTFTCTRCEENVTQTLETLGHSFTDYVRTEATCTEDAYERASCDRCDETDTRRMEDTALGHDFAANGYCTRCELLDPSRKVSTVSITNESLLLEAGKPIRIGYAVYPENAIYGEVTYRIYQTNTCDATLTEDGVLTCAKVGSVTVAVTVDGEVTARATFYVPQMISTAEEFFNIREDLSGIYMLANDVDLSGYEHWSPIGSATRSSSGSYDYSNAFRGRLDGGGYTVSGVHLDLSHESCASLLTVGLFGSLARDGVISNLKLSDAVVVGSSEETDYVGMLVGFNPGSVENCSVSGTAEISQTKYVGGVIGENIGRVSGVDASVSVRLLSGGSCYVGGIMGRSTGGQISDVRVVGTVGAVGGNVYVGGIAGELTEKLTDAEVSVEINVDCDEIGTDNYVGGAVGYTGQELSGIRAEGSVSVLGSGTVYLGGVIGRSTASVKDCESTVALTLAADSGSPVGYLYAGGIVGSTEGNVESCKNSGRIDAENFCAAYVGGVVGKGGTVSACENSGELSLSSLQRSTTARSGFYVGGVVGLASGVSGCSNTAALTLNAYSDMGAYFAGVAGSTTDATDCTNGARITLTATTGNESGIGGVIGQASGTVSGCKNLRSGDVLVTVNQRGVQLVGGIVGFGDGEITDCTNYASIAVYTDTSAVVGGVFGWRGGAAERVYNYGSSILLDGEGSGDTSYHYVGGIGGRSQAVKDAYSTAELRAFSTHVNLGGLVGKAEGAVENARATANLFLTGGSGNKYTSYVGGLVGYATASVKTSAATGGEITADFANDICLGGLVGYSEGSVSDCFAYPELCLTRGRSSYVGGLVGRANEILRGYAVGDVTADCRGLATLRIGGLAGSASGSVNECYSTGDVYGTVTPGKYSDMQSGTIVIYLGGLIGSAESGSDVRNSYSTNALIRTDASMISTEIGSDTYNGGLIGFCEGSVSDCYAVNYNQTVSHGSPTGHYHTIGGLIGYCTENANVSSCYVLDAIARHGRTDVELSRAVEGSGAATLFAAGGFVGDNRGKISNCYTEAAVNTTVSGAYTGGFVGRSSDSVKYCIAYGEVNSGIGGDTTGGFSGATATVSGKTPYTDCFFATDLTKQEQGVGAFVDGSETVETDVTGLSGEALRRASVYSAFDAEEWSITDGRYPTLQHGEAWESRSDGFNRYAMLLNVPNESLQYKSPHDNRVTVTLTGEAESEATVLTVCQGDKITLPTLESYEADGVTYTFVGWCLDEACLQTVEDPTVTVTETVTYYASYTEAEENIQ